MTDPFTFGKIATSDNFTNRTKEIESLSRNFLSGINTTIISPRRWGKSSLVQRAGESAMRKSKNCRVVHLDIFNVRNEEEFYLHLAQEVIKSTSTGFEVRAKATAHFLRRFIPKVSYNPTPTDDFSLSLDWKEVKKHPDEIITLAESIAVDRGWRIVVCIDEFQNVALFESPVAFQKKLRSHWQKHQNVTYCLYGSKRHMMMDVFTSASMPFYRFGDILYLEKIDEEEWVRFLTKRFTATGKRISTVNARLLAQSAENHPYYVQQLAHMSWLISGKICKEKDIVQALDTIVRQLSLSFQTQTDTLGNAQVNFLHAMIKREKSMSSYETIERFRLGSSSNVQQAKKALLSKEIIDDAHGDIYILDPMYKHWLTNYYFI